MFAEGVDLLPGGRTIDPGPLMLPMPTQVSDKPQILSSEKLISAKLSTYIGRGIERSQNLADVVKLAETWESDVAPWEDFAPTLASNLSIGFSSEDRPPKWDAAGLSFSIVDSRLPRHRCSGSDALCAVALR